ncbi:hypothetical protein GQ43DRAFT_476372 [Delitschia confertaspora ATCC 74209]|uniref:Uncharacterized protein n=1 Tax=Delitschia confertaspora ATCC 74209 TaxID=1513339 RepID=A0A9P4JEJ2_9PLEO|nr:hypothetical protein GQ43DRAFT_476372 [Delitschia confertaspora ATCC 74209]
MSSAQFCEIVESTLLCYLGRGHRRVDCKLTLSERERLQKSFQTTWQLAHQLSNPEEASLADNELSQMKLQDLLRIREIATFLYINITKADREKIASMAGSSNGDGTTRGTYDDARITEGFLRIIKIFVDRIINERGGSYHIPDGAPLDLFSFFDQWQGDVEECVSWEK